MIEANLWGKYMFCESRVAGGRDRLIEEMSEAQAYLIQTRSDWAQHIKDIHKGWPATTCHRCMTYKQGIQSNERFLEEANRELKSLI